VGYRIAADLVVALHFAFITFVILGGFVAWRWPRVAWLHVPIALWGALIEFAGWICPLTPLENALRRSAGDAGYAGGFIEHYVIPVVYPAGLTPAFQVALGAAVLFVNGMAYGVLLRRRRRRKGEQGAGSGTLR
jgi:hypothetical protein